jgi:hypothetical protein
VAAVLPLVTSGTDPGPSSLVLHNISAYCPLLLFSCSTYTSTRCAPPKRPTTPSSSCHSPAPSTDHIIIVITALMAVFMSRKGRDVSVKFWI